MVMIDKRENEDGHVTFESSNHSSSILAGLKYLREKEHLFDVTLCVQNQKFQAHKVVLASCSDYFRAMFTDGLKETQQIEIHLNGVTAKGINSIIDFAYTSKLSLDFDNVEDVLLSANHIQMIPVLQACEKFLKDNLSLENCSNMATWADMFSMASLKDHIYRFMCSNLSHLMLLPNFLNLPVSQFLTLLRSQYPVDCSETDILRGVLEWVEFNSDRESNLVELINHINFQNVEYGLKTEILKRNFETCQFRLSPEVSDIISCKLGAKLNYGEEFLKDSDSCSQQVNDSGLINTRGYTKALVCVGGFSPRQGMTNDLCFLKYGPRSGLNPWQHLGHIPHVPQCNFGQAVLKNELYVIGGCYNDNMVEVVHNYAFKYNPGNNTWTCLSPMAKERCRFYLGVLGSSLYAIGGDPSASDPTLSQLAPCEKYDPQRDTWSAIASLPVNRSQHAGVCFKECLYVSGGLQDLEEEVFSDFYKYTPTEDRWEELPELSIPRADHTMFVYKGSIYVIGGWYLHANQSRVMAANIDRYNESTRTWETIGTLPSPRIYATYTLHGDEIYVIGGWHHGDYQRKAQTVQIYHMVTGDVHEDGEAGMEIWEHTCSNLYVPTQV